MDNFDKLASFTPQATQRVTQHGDVAGLGNFLSGGSIKANREIEKMNLQHQNNFQLAKWQAQWNKAMDDTKAQRHALDLQKAGINPILAHGQTLQNVPSGASAGSAGVGSDSTADGASGKLKKAIKLLAALVLKSFGGN